MITLNIGTPVARTLAEMIDVVLSAHHSWTPYEVAEMQSAREQLLAYEGSEHGDSSERRH